MSYATFANRAHPVLLVLLLDDSGSMSWTLAGGNDSRFSWVEKDVGIVLRELLVRSTEMKGDAPKVKPRYYLYVVIYGSSPRVWGDGLMDIETAVEAFTKAGDKLGLGGTEGGTDSSAAMMAIEPMLQQAVSDPRFADSFPPMVIHITDGESESDPSAVAERLKKLATHDGNVLMVNAYIGTQTNLQYQGPDDFPGYVDVSEVGDSRDNINLFNMSSDVPDTIYQNLRALGVFPKIRPGARLFVDVRTPEMLKHVIQIVASIPSQAAR